VHAIRDRSGRRAILIRVNNNSVLLDCKVFDQEIIKLAVQRTEFVWIPKEYWLKR